MFEGAPAKHYRGLTRMNADQKKARNFTTEARRHGEEKNKNLTLISRITRIALPIPAILAISAILAILLIRVHRR
jgi:hypothetical protein